MAMAALIDLAMSRVRIALVDCLAQAAGADDAGDHDHAERHHQALVDARHDAGMAKGSLILTNICQASGRLPGRVR